MGWGALDIPQLWNIQPVALLGTSGWRPLPAVDLSAPLFIVGGSSRCLKFRSTTHRSTIKDHIRGGYRQRCLLWISKPRTRLAH